MCLLLALLCLVMPVAAIRAADPAPVAGSGGIVVSAQHLASNLGVAILRQGATLGLYTQPMSFIGLPVLTAPVMRLRGLPGGIQLAAAPGREALLLETAAPWEPAGVIGRNSLPHTTAAGLAA